MILAFVGLFSCGTGASSDWTTGYVARTENEDSFLHITARYAQGPRRVVSLNGIWQARDASDSAWLNVAVPGAYVDRREVEFRRSVFFDSSFSGQAVQLMAYGIAGQCRIFINGEFLASHASGHTSFAMDLTNKIAIGRDNDIRIVVNNKLDARHSLPLLHSPGLPLQYGGIYRDIFLLVVPEIHIAGVRYDPVFEPDLSACKLAVSVTLNRPAGVAAAQSEMQLSAELIAAGSRPSSVKSRPVPVLLRGRYGEHDLSIAVANARLWAPETPNLYDLRIELRKKYQLVDVKIVRIGLKQFRIDRGQALLNGSALRFKGMEWHERFPDTGICAGWSQIARDLYDMKNAGVNAIRIPGGAPHPFLLELCDEIGLLVFQEMPLSFVPDVRLSNATFVEMVSNSFAEMLERDHNHVSMLAWGLGTDLQCGAGFRSFVQPLQKVAQSYSTMPLYVNYRFVKPDTCSLVPELPVLLWNGFDMEPDELAARFDFPGSAEKLVLVSVGYRLATGQPDGLAGERGGYEADISNQEIQAYRLGRVLRMQPLEAACAGVFVSSYADWPQQYVSGGESGDPAGRISSSGLVDQYRKARIAYQVVESKFTDTKPVRMSVQIPEPKSPVIFPVAGLILILLFLFNFNRNRRLRGNLRRIFVYPQGFYVELSENRKVTVWHTVLFCVIACCSLAVILSSILYNFRENVIFDSWLNLNIHADPVKSWIVWAVWHPGAAIVVFIVGLFFLFALIILVLRTTAFLLGLRRCGDGVLVRHQTFSRRSGYARHDAWQSLAFWRHLVNHLFGWGHLVLRCQVCGFRLHGFLLAGAATARCAILNSESQNITK
jgi:hypothetical protein